MGIISTAARKSFEHLFVAALQANIALRSSDEVAVCPVAAPQGRAERRRTLVLLTSASLRFKLMAVFQVVDEARVHDYFGGADHAVDHLETLCERGNLCCGAMNRDLQRYVPHIGLSTPSVLGGLTSKVLEALHAEHVAHFEIQVNGVHLLDASLCMRGKAEVDFVADTRLAPAETGELELF